MKFQKLVSTVRKLRWPVRMISAVKSERTADGAYPGRLTLGVTLYNGGAWTVVGRSRSEAGFRRFMKTLGYGRWARGSNAWYRRGCTLPIEAEPERIVRACREGTGRARRVRPPKFARTWKNERGQQECWRFVDRLGTGWRPTLLFLRQEQSVTRGGIRWRVDHDGYWKPSCRNGLEAYLEITSRQEVSLRP